jgi:hypothetical protein
LLPLLHQDAVFVEFAHETLDYVVFEGQFLEEEVLGERIHYDCLLHAGVEVVDDHVESLIVAADNSVCPAVCQSQLLLHVTFHEIEFVDAFFDDAGGKLADHHVVFLHLLLHEIDLIFQLVQLVDQPLGSLLVPNRLQIEYLLHILQRFYLVVLVFLALVHTRHADNRLVVFTVQVQQIFVLPTNGLVSQISKQILNVLFGIFDVLQGEYIVLIEVQIVVDLLQRLKNLERFLSSILHAKMLLAWLLFLPTLHF